MSIVHIALIQMRTGRDVAANVAAASDAITQAAKLGAQFIATPEMTTLLERDRAQLFEKAGTENTDRTISHFSQLAARLGVTLLIGSMPIRLTDTTLANRSHLFLPTGRLIAHYDKLHMFDVAVDAKNIWKESATYQAGNRAVLVDIGEARIGLSICYDLRFAQLYAHLASAGAHILMVPSSFTKPTGAAHWHTLLRARAIETGCFVLAPAQGGRHEDGRETFGHSLVVNPWGEIIAEVTHDAPAILHRTLDLDEVSAARARIPALTHARSWALDTLSAKES